MKQVTCEPLTDLLEVMTITHSNDSDFAITHTGHVEGVPTIAISIYRGDGIVQ